MNQTATQVTAGFLRLAEEGLANAARSLEILLSHRLQMDVLWVGSVPTARLSELSGNPEDLVVGAYVHVNGDLPGHALLLFPLANALKLADLALGQPVGTSCELGQMEESVVQEVANILTSSYITALADHHGIALLPDPPLTAVDMAAAMVDNVLLNSGQFEPETLGIVTRFRSASEVVDGFFLYVPESY